MKISIVIATRGDDKNVSHMMECFKAQTFQDFEVVFVVDKKIVPCPPGGRMGSEYPSDDKYRFISEFNANFTPYQGASYVRNYGLKKATGEFINIMDDDEYFAPDYLQKSLDLREKYRQEVGKEFILTPTLMYRHTGKVQNRGFSYFNRRLGRPTPYKLGDKDYGYIQMFSCNSLFGPSHIFQTVKFDEKMDFVNEDLDFTYRIYKAGYPLIVVKDLQIHHMERDKAKLEHRRIGSQFQAYKKMKHKIRFVKKNGTLGQKIAFFICGLPIVTIVSIARILCSGKGVKKWSLIKSLFRGISGK